MWGKEWQVCWEVGRSDGMTWGSEERCGGVGRSVGRVEGNEGKYG